MYPKLSTNPLFDKQTHLSPFSMSKVLLAFAAQ